VSTDPTSSAPSVQLAALIAEGRPIAAVSATLAVEALRRTLVDLAALLDARPPTIDGRPAPPYVVNTARIERLATQARYDLEDLARSLQAALDHDEAGPC
jgi:hypothetical protein